MTEESYTDDADVSHLETRIDELEETIAKMLPSRREALGMGVAGLAGASLMSGTASAGSAQVGTIGDGSNLVDVEAEDINVSDTLTTQDIVVNGTATGPFGDFNFELLDTINSSISANSTKSLNVTGNANQFLLTFNFPGNGNGKATFLRFNGVTTSDYAFNVLETDTIVARTGQDKFDFIEQQGGSSYTGSYLISDINARMSISGTGFAYPLFNRFTLMNGVLDTPGAGPLNSVDVLGGVQGIDLSGDAKIELFGRI